jgi:bifunctional N-acetylglucosamine-1-phosphate-uridyltransferase/glucosamine-1-phosphate-acetyltransferase GlmU-like protein
VAACKTLDASLVLGVNSREELALAKETMAKCGRAQGPAAERTHSGP